MIKNSQFDLGGFRMVESSEAGMLVQVSRAIKKKSRWSSRLGAAPDEYPVRHHLPVRR